MSGTDIIRGGLKEDTANHGVNRNALSGACGSSHQEVRHPGKIHHKRSSRDVFSKPEGEF
jgi:hypothetical protein